MPESLVIILENRPENGEIKQVSQGEGEILDSARRQPQAPETPSGSKNEAVTPELCPVGTNQKAPGNSSMKTEASDAGMQRGVQPPVEPSAPNVIPGRFSHGHTASIQHGLNTDRLPPEFEFLRQEVNAFMAACLSDEGGQEEISHRRRALLEYRARLHRRIAQLDTALETRGLFDKRGKLRVAWLQRLEGLIASAKGIDSTLGLARRTKRVPSLAEVLGEEAQS